MNFYVATESGSGCTYFTKEEFLAEVGMMIDDCVANGGSFFHAFVEADASCYADSNENG